MRVKPRIIKSIAAFFVPLIICFIYLLIRGSFNLYLPDSYNNDCLFYYKLVEGIVNGGIKGFFGFNESSALVGGFAAWNPAVVMPWVIFGFIFRWGYPSVFFCNVLLFSAALAAFTYLTDLPVKKLVSIGVVLLLFPSIPIHLLNALPEAVVTSFVILYLGFAIRCSIANGDMMNANAKESAPVGKNDSKKDKTAYVVDMIGMLVCSFYLTLCRPYMILFFILPVYFAVRKIREQRYSVEKDNNPGAVTSAIKASIGVIFAVISCLAACLALLAYYIIGHYFTAAYFEPLFNMDILKMFLHGNFSEGFWMSVSVSKRMLGGIGSYIGDAFSFGFTAGTHYVITITCTLILLVQIFNKKNKSLRPVYFLYVLTSVLLFPAIIIFLQKVNEGGRHVWFLAVTGIILVSLAEWDINGIISKAVMAVLLLAFVVRGGLYPTDYDVPFRQEGSAEKIAFWKDTFEKEGMMPVGEKGYDNTIIWVYYDYDDAEKMVVTDYNSLYAVPAGMGISCCMPEYVLPNVDSLKSKYIATDTRGRVAKALEEEGITPLAVRGELAVYKVR